ncbi:MAG: phage/plasmid primase, P4 family [Planctomycetota bacterium]
MNAPRPQAARHGYADYLAALDRIDAEPEPVWFRVAGVLASAVVREELTAEEASKAYHSWSARSSKYDESEATTKLQRALDSVGNDGGDVATLYRYAKEWPARKVDPVTGEPEPETDCWFASESNRNHNVAAQKFVETYGDRVRYVSAWKKWLAWDGRRWVTDFNDVGVNELISNFADSLWDQIPRNLSAKEAGKVNTFLKSLNNVGGTQGVEKMSRGKPRVACHYNDLDADPYLLNVQNGTLNMNTGELQPHDPNDMITKIADDVVYDPSATCPKWDDTLRYVYQTDQELIDYVEEVFGYMLTGDTGEAIMPISYGTGNNGKSTIWNTVSKIGGEYVEMGSDTLLLGEKNSHPTEMADLFGKRLIIINEPDEGSTLKEGRLKYLTGDPFIKARRMHEDLWEFKRTSKFLLVTNHLPKIRSLDNGLRRRIKQIPHNADFDKIGGLKVIKNYADILAREEGSGILNRLLAGFHRYLENGEFTQPEAVTHATDEYLNEEDSLGQFIAECCELDPHAWETASALYEAYQLGAGRDTKTQNAFGRALAERTGINKGETRKLVRGKKAVIYEGIRLRESKKN